MSLIKTLLTLSAATLLSSAAAYAQTPIPNDPGHPRVNEVDQRLNNQQNRVNNDVANGTMTQGQANRDEARDQHIENQATRDEAKNGGHLTKGEQRHLNKEENHNSRDIHKQHRHGKKREHQEHRE